MSRSSADRLGAGWWMSGRASTNEPVFVSDSAGTIRFWNRAAERLTGYRADEVMGRKCHAVLCGRRAGRTWCQADCAIRRCVRRGSLPSHISLEMRTRAGRRIPVEARFVVHRGPRGYAVAHVLGDASQTERMRQILREILSLVQGPAARRANAAPPSDAFDDAPAAAAPRDVSVLTRREVEALRLLTEGLSTDQVGATLGIRPLTARNHIQHAVRKLGVHTRAQAVAAAFEQGLV